jgi:3-hydroxyacyl-CoA dehydrogenase / enoyl-CoA hydratase / 3-hydroxybutyryl-CoA epimerase
MIKYKKSIDNIVELTFDMKGQTRNIINHSLVNILTPILNQLDRELKSSQLKGIILTSAKKNFIEGGYIDYLYHATKEDAPNIYRQAEELKQIFRRLESLEVPVVAAINGKTTSTGFELALACHYRVALNASHTLIGFPEVHLGIIPGGGGTGRLIWMIGMKKAFPIIAEGQLFQANEALKMGLVDELVDDADSLIARAKKWILSNQDAQQPWDKKKGSYSAYNVKKPATAEWIAKTSATTITRYKRNFPAITAILDIMVNGIAFDFDTVSKIESRYFTELTLSNTAKNMMQTFWYDLNAVKGGKARPKGYGRFRPRKIGVIGAGEMGSAIAATAAATGLEVVLKDVSKTVAERGKAKACRILEGKALHNEITKAEAERATALIKPTNSVKDFEDCDLVIEAVFENIDIKSKVIRESDNFMDEYAMFASNTSSLSISKLAKETTRPENFIGLKFFNPVETEQLVEVICGTKTSEETIARGIDFVRKLRKIPIVIQDKRGFFTTRVMEAYALEGIALLKDGCLPAVIEQMAVNHGMKKGPLAMMDDMSIANTLKFEELKLKYIEEDYTYHEELKIMREMVNVHQRPGRKSQKGFYDYTEQKTELWSELTTHFHAAQDNQISKKEIIERLMFIQVLEAMRCLDTKVINSVEEVNIGSVYGWGFAAQKGGVLQYVNDYGVEKFLERTKEFCAKYGDRFAPPQNLIDRVEAAQ